MHFWSASSVVAFVRALVPIAYLFVTAHWRCATSSLTVTMSTRTRAIPAVCRGSYPVSWVAAFGQAKIIIVYHIRCLGSLRLVFRRRPLQPPSIWVSTNSATLRPCSPVTSQLDHSARVITNHLHAGFHQPSNKSASSPAKGGHAVRDRSLDLEHPFLLEMLPRRQSLLIANCQRAQDL